MTKQELNFIKDAFSQIIDDIAGNPDWGDAARSVASNLGTLERELEEKVVELPSDLDEAAEEYSLDVKAKPYENLVKEAFKDGSKWRDAQIPKLPDNVGEAAEKYANETTKMILNVFENVGRYEGFKAGANWRDSQIQKLPSNLDEAANSYAWEKQENHIDFDGDEYLDYGPRYDAFKAGAEWMAGQGETRIVRANADLDPHGADYGIRYLDIRVEDDIPVGTRFIVQIRKK